MTATSIPALLEPIQERLDAATPGPWSATQAADEESTTWIEATNGDVLHHDERGYGHMRENFAWMKRADADFIANAPTDTARLLAAVKAVTEMHRREVIAVHEGHGEEATCTECGHYWPCPTSAAVEAALRSEA